MSNSIRQIGTTINLDKERHLCFDLNALCELEEKYGDVSSAMAGLGKQPKMKDIRYILFLALKHEDEDLDELKVGKLITIGNITTIANALGEAMSESLPETKNV